MSRFFGSTVENADHREYGKAIVNVVRGDEAHKKELGAKDVKIGEHVDRFFHGVEGDLPVGQAKHASLET